MLGRATLRSGDVMSLHLVIHRPEEPAGSAPEAAVRAALRDAVWEVADSHWAAGEEAMLVSCDLSSDYLVSHFMGALARGGFAQPGMLIVVPMRQGSAWAGLPAEAEAWIRETI
jgi:hypothetical protein